MSSSSLRSSEPAAPPSAAGAAWSALAPVVVFYAVEQLAGTRPAVAASLALAAGEVAWSRWRHGAVPRTVLLSAGLIALLGVPALWTDDPRFVLWGPVVGDLLFAALLVGSHLVGAPMLRGAMLEQLPPEDHQPPLLAWVDGAGRRMAGFLVLHAAATAWATGGSRELWLAVSGPGQWVTLGAQVALEAVLLRTRVLPALDAAASAPAVHEQPAQEPVDEVRAPHR